jgi:crotonobetainyl-CoA:carnitine CoA-transferase CaiB-like acyl-CoA transferase
MTAPPLAGIRVLDFSRVLSGPHCGRALVDLGADVIKIEPPEGDMTRFARPRTNSISTYYTQQNLGKRNISLDLGQAESRELLRRMAGKADVLLENFRPGVMDRLGLGYAALAPENPRLVYAAITGYGQAGPWAHRRAYAPLIHAEMGLLEGFARYRGDEAKQEPYSHADVFSGVYCLAGILAALYQRERTGRGQHLDLAMAETMLMVNEYSAAELSGMREELPRRPATIASPMFQTADGHAVTVGGDPPAKGNFEAWCRAMGRDDLRADPRFADPAHRHAHRAELHAILAEWVGKFDDLEALDARLAEAGLVLGVVRSVEEAGETAWTRARGAAVEVSDRGSGRLRVPNTPWRFSGAQTGARGVAAYRGEHNREVLSELLGLSGAELDRLEREGVLSSRLPDQP